jgi:2-polyprenyl-6-methoxyphenol hydroxylase-like FAD-dependent oxidoreductase
LTTPLQIYIEGNGPVGLACALFLARHWPEPAAISLTPPAPVDAADHSDPSRVAQAALAKRPLALSAGSRQLIERVARFPAQCGAILTVEVALENRAGRVRIPSSDLDQSALGYVLRHGDLVESLEAALAQTGVRRETPVLQDFQGLIIRASGDPGRTPQEAEGRDFQQSALLGEVTLDRGSAWATGTALERFTAQGPLAMVEFMIAGHIDHMRELETASLQELAKAHSLRLACAQTLSYNACT